MSDTPFADAARRYVECGLTVLPLCPPDHVGCNSIHTDRCRKPGKAPLVNWSRIREVGASAEAVARWVRRWPGANVGMVAGMSSGVVVLDVDSEEGAEHIRPFQMPETPTARSHRGLRYHLEAPPTPLRTRAGLLPGVDLQAEGACAVLPPSRHVSGTVYTWEVPLEAGLAPCPDWLLELAQGPPRITNNGSDAWVTRWQGVPEGQRDDTAAKLAGRLLRFGLPAEEVQEILSGWALRNPERSHPWGEADVARVVASIAAKEAQAALLRAQDGSLYATAWVDHLRKADVAIYEALRAIERERGYTPGARLFVSYRELADASGYGVGTIGGALRRLSWAGLIQYRPGTPGMESAVASEVKRILPMPASFRVETNPSAPGISLCSVRAAAEK